MNTMTILGQLLASVLALLALTSACQLILTATRHLPAPTRSRLPRSWS